MDLHWPWLLHLTKSQLEANYHKVAHVEPIHVQFLYLTASDNRAVVRKQDPKALPTWYACNKRLLLLESLSNQGAPGILALLQATRIQIALANGTLLEVTPESNPFLWKAVQVHTSKLVNQTLEE
jgi:hypothetical protein